MLYFVDGKPTKPYREIAKLAGCSLGMVSYYKDTKKAIMNINKNSGRDKWHQVWDLFYMVVRNIQTETHI